MTFWPQLARSRAEPFLFANFDAKGKDVYKESIKYLDRYKSGDKRPKGAPKTGFGTSDFPKRDEYTNTIRTEQLREVLRREGRMETARRRTEDERMKTAGVRPRTGIYPGFEDECFACAHNLLRSRRAKRGSSTLGRSEKGRSLRPCFPYAGYQPAPAPVRQVMLMLLHAKCLRGVARAMTLSAPASDDRGGRTFFMGLRQKQKLQDEGTYVEEKPKIVEGHAWVSVTLPNGEYRQILVNEERQVLAKRPMSAHI